MFGVKVRLLEVHKFVSLQPSQRSEKQLF